MRGVIYLPGSNIIRSKAELLVNTTNAVGVLGKGVALEFNRTWPVAMEPYKDDCFAGRLQAGQCRIYRLPDQRYWAALCTKAHWRDPSKMEWVISGLSELAIKARELQVRSIAIPPPGCGNGGLSWSEVRPHVLEKLKGFDLEIYGEPPAWEIDLFAEPGP